MLKRRTREHDSSTKSNYKPNATLTNTQVLPCIVRRKRINSVDVSASLLDASIIDSLKEIARGFTDNDELSELREKCVVIMKFLNDIMQSIKFNRPPPHFLDDYVFKIVIKCFYYYHENISPSNLQNIRTLNTLLILYLYGEPKSMIKEGQLLFKSVKTMHEQLKNNKVNIFKAAKLIHYQYQGFSILAALDGSKEFVKLYAEALEKGIRESCDKLNDCYEVALGKEEYWMTSLKDHVKVNYLFNRKILTVVKFSEDRMSHRFTPRYECLYYTKKAIKLLATKESQALLEKLLETIMTLLKLKSTLLKQEKLPTNNVESHLNEILICFNIIKHIINNPNPPLLSKLNDLSFLKPLIYSYITLIFKHKFLYNTYDENEIISYRTTHDYLSGLFRFMSEVKNAKEFTSYTRSTNTKTSILKLFEEIINELLKYIENSIILKDYIVEYLYKNNRNITKQTVECLVKIVETTSFTAPKSISGEIKEQGMKALTNKRIVSLLNTILNDDKFWAESILGHLIELIKELYNNKELLFGIYKLIYCGLTNTVCSNIEFYTKLFTKAEVIVDKEYSKAIKGFANIEGTTQILNVIINDLYKTELEDIIEMTSKFIIILLDIPLLAEKLLKESALIMKVLEASHSISFTTRFIQKLLELVKQSAKITEDYLPLALIKLTINNKNTEKTLIFIKLVINFLSQEFTSIVVHQAFLKERIDLPSLFITPLTGEIAILYMRLVYKLQKNNDQVAKDIKKSKLIKGKVLYKFIKDCIQKVNVVMTNS